jgi:hypothetical protein
MQDSDLVNLGRQLEEHIVNNQQAHVRQMGFEFLGKGRRAQAALCFKLLKNSNIGDIQARTMYVQATLTHDQPSYAAARDEFLSILRDFPSLVTDPSEFACTIVRNAAHTCIWTNDFEKAKELLEELVKSSAVASDFELLKGVYENFGDLKGELWARKEMLRLDSPTYSTSENNQKILQIEQFLASEHKQKKINIRRYPTTDLLRQELKLTILDQISPKDIGNIKLPTGQEPCVYVMGGCWHRDFGIALQSVNIKHHFIPILDDVNSCAGNLMFMRWICGLKEFHVSEAIKNDAKESPESIREKIKQSNIIVLTYTKAFELFDNVNQHVEVGELSLFTIKALTQKFNYRLSNVEDNVRAIVSTVHLLRTINPEAKIVLQISPTPLFGSVGDDSAVSNDFLSKAMLRVSINEAISRWDLKNVVYWPTIEIFRWVASHQTSFYGGDDGSAWHASLAATKANAAAFLESIQGKQ